MSKAKSITVTLPGELSGLRIPHLAPIKDATENDLFSIDKRINVVSAFTGVSTEDLSQYLMRDINAVFEHIIGLYCQYKRSEPKPEIELNGTIYSLIQDFGSDVPSGFHIDIDGFKDRFVDQPELIAAFCYVKKGTRYGQRNEFQQVIDKLEDRAKVMKEHLPLNEYINLLSFFLLKHRQLVPGYLAAVKLKVNRIKTDKLIGSKSLIQLPKVIT